MLDVNLLGPFLLCREIGTMMLEKRSGLYNDLFLADPEQSAFVNGHALSVDGGWFADAGWESLRLRHR